MSPIAVMQICDSLDAGGLERVAVNVANHLPRDRYRSHLCTTRAEGPLAEGISPQVGRLRLERRGRFDARALPRLTGYIREHDVRILQPHGSSLFIAVLASLFAPHPAVIWHDHFGRHATDQRPVWIYRLAARRLAGVVAVNEPLAEWSRRRLRVRADRVWYLPNFVCEPPAVEPRPELPGTPGFRVVCVANLRREKDHLTLLRAMQSVVQHVPSAHLLLLGNGHDRDYAAEVKQAMTQNGLAGHVSWLGSRRDVSAVLKACDVGVLSSVSEGLPLALIEYGMNGLPAVATRVGQCEEVLDGGRAGLVAPPSSPEELAHAIVSLLESPERRASLGREFRQRTTRVYSADSFVKRICDVYELVLSDRSGAAER